MLIGIRAHDGNFFSKRASFENYGYSYVEKLTARMSRLILAKGVIKSAPTVVDKGVKIVVYLAW